MIRSLRVPGSVLRFLVAGAATTVVTLGLYVLLLDILAYALAYTVAFVSGILIAYLLNSVFVFRTATSMRTFALFPLIYLVQYLVGLTVTAIWVDLLGLPPEVAALAAIVVTLPITYLLTRSLLTRRRSLPDQRP
jgi:putative flippase GtrA